MVPQRSLWIHARVELIPIPLLTESVVLRQIERAFIGIKRYLFPAIRSSQTPNALCYRQVPGREVGALDHFKISKS